MPLAISPESGNMSSYSGGFVMILNIVPLQCQSFMTRRPFFFFFFFVAPRVLFKGASGLCSPLIGQPVLCGRRAIDFYLRCYLLMDTKPVAFYGSRLPDRH